MVKRGHTSGTRHPLNTTMPSCVLVRSISRDAPGSSKSFPCDLRLRVEDVYQVDDGSAKVSTVQKLHKFFTRLCKALSQAFSYGLCRASIRKLGRRRVCWILGLMCYRILWGFLWV